MLLVQFSKSIIYYSTLTGCLGEAGFPLADGGLLLEAGPLMPYPGAVVGQGLIF